MKKRIVALLLCCVMLLTLSPSLIASASATEETPATTTEEPKAEEPTVEETTVEETTTEPETEEPTVDKATTLEANGGAVVYGPGDASNQTAILHCVSSNVEVGYLVFDDNTQTISFTSLANGGKAESNVYSRDNQKGFVFFIKPSAGYLLTTMTLTTKNGSQDVDLYSIDVPAKDTKFSYISNHQTIGDKVLAAAKTAGYVAYFGYTLQGSGFEHTLTATAEKPGIKVDVTAEPNTNIRPGTNITYTIVITPEKTNAKDAKVDKVLLKDLELNGEKLGVSDLNVVTNSDGTYTVKIPHTVTEEEWLNSLANISVTAELDYSYKLTVKDRDGKKSDVPTTAKVESTGTAQCTFDEKKNVIYELTFDAPDGVTPPDTIPEAPVDRNDYWNENTIATIVGYDRTEVDDPANGGTWTFAGWYVGNDRGKAYDAGETLKITGNTKLVGVWTFVEYPLADLTITKTYKDGKLLDNNQSAVFTVSDGKGFSVDVVIHGDNNSVTIKDLKVGTTYTVTEKTSWTWRYNTTGSQSIELKATGNNKVEFTNTLSKDLWLTGGTYCDNRFDGKNTTITPASN